MADLNQGSTIGGKRIIHQGNADEHTHHIDDIVDIGSAAYKDTGAGGGLYADVISGKHYSDLEDDFVNTSGDSIESVILNDDPVQNSDAVTFNYLQTVANNYHPNGFMNLTIIGDLSQPLSYTIHNSKEFTLGEIDLMFSGINYKVEEQFFYIIDAEPRYENNIVYIYISYDVVNDTWYYSFDTDDKINTNKLIQIGYITNDSNGIQSINLIQDDNRVGFNHYLISHQKRPYSMIVSNNNGKIDSQFYPSNHSALTTVDGPQYIEPSQTYMYEITNFNNFSGYYTNVSEGSSYLDGNIIQVQTPGTISGNNITLSITRDSYTVEYSLIPVSTLESFVYAVGDDDQLHQITLNGSIVGNFNVITDNIFAVDIDDNQNAYVGAADNTVRKVSPSNSQVWSNTDFTSNVTGVKVDHSGSVYASSLDQTVRKIDTSGNTVWTFNGHSNQVLDVLLDEDGDIYSHDSSNLYKIDSSNNQLLSETHNNMSAYYVDNVENKYVGYTNGNVEKYNSLYELLWTYTSLSNVVNTIIADDLGNVYIGGNDQVIDKINSSGNIIWRFIGHDNNINSISIDNNYELYTTSEDNTVRKISDEGVQQWINNFTNSMNGAETYLDGVILEGPRYLESGNSYQYTIRNYDSSKTYSATIDQGSVSISTNTITVNTPNSNTNESQILLTVSDGEVSKQYNLLYVYDEIELTGPDPVQSNNSYQYTITNYEPHKSYNVSSNLGSVSISGDTVTLNTPSSNNTEQTLTININDSTVYSSLDVTYLYDDILISGPSDLEAGNTYQYTITNYVSGRNYTVSASLGSASVSGDTITLDLTNVSSSGTTTITVSDENISSSYNYNVEVLNNIYTSSWDNTIRKIDTNGNQVWSVTGPNSIVERIVVDDNGNSYSISEDTVIKVDTDGNEVWTYVTSSLDSIAVDKNYNIYISYFSSNEIKKLDNNRNIIWTNGSHTSYVNALTVDQNGNVYSGSSDQTVRKIDSNGNEVWSFTGHSDLVVSIAVDQNGNVYSGSIDNTLRKIDSNGNEVWSFTGHTDDVSTISIDNNGYIYTGSGDTTVKKINNNGNTIWTYTGNTSYIFGVSVDKDGNVYSGSLNDTLRKINSSGNGVWAFTSYNGRVSGVATSPGKYDAGFW